MKFKKYSYLIAFILMLLIGINGVEAKVNKTCYYIEGGKQSLTTVKIQDGSWHIKYTFQPSKAYAEAFVNKLGKKIDNDSEPILNWYDEEKDNVTGMTLNAINSSKKVAAKSTTCPNYLIVRTDKKYSSYGVFATNSETVAKQFVEKSNATGDYKTWYLSSKDSNGNEYTSNDYYDTFITMDSGNVYDNSWCEPDPVTGEVDPDCYQIRCDKLFGDKKDDGDKNDVNKDGTASIAYLMDSVLQYVRVIVPILIIVIGVFDLSKAVISSKEDEMRKAQSKFIRRLLLGLVVFFVPLFVNVIMELADLVWESMGYSSCEFR